MSADFEIPSTQQALCLRAAGLDQLTLERMPVAQPKDDEILVRIDAVGICASDVKLAIQGNTHARIRGLDLSAQPIIPGHEVSLTVVKAGRARTKDYQPGQRYAVQANIVYKGQEMCYGYRLPGAMQQFQCIGSPVIDTNSLLPVDPKLGYAQAALAEPWACVYYSYYRHRAEHQVLRGGTVWYVGAGPLGLMHIEKGIADGAKKIVVSELSQTRLDKVRQNLGPLAEKAGAELILVNTAKDPLDKYLSKAEADDIVILCPVAKVVEQAIPFLAFEGYLNVFAGFPSRDKSNIILNLNDMHYGGWTLVASSGSPIEALAQTLADSATGKIDPNNAVACVGGLNAAKEALQAVHDGTYPGRIVIYPQLDMPLTDTTKLITQGRWSNQAEQKLLESAASK
ncbi:MAG: alcohol dehydrogenase catalytic domain-containing protein [Actinobacteria bacterium]|nr:alcohol dehydrogenase catalytic domain-containing protein [Actinomycetota bacterium]